jgi:antitoxin component YwqK of YwqJK toxin-antitoxin module
MPIETDNLTTQTKFCTSVVDGLEYYKEFTMNSNKKKHGTYRAYYIMMGDEVAHVQRTRRLPLCVELEYENGKKNGPMVRFWSNGNRHISANFKNGKYHGPVEIFYEDGSLESRSIFYNGKLNGMCMNVTPEGITEYTTYVNGKRNGTKMIFASNGTVLKRRFYRNDDVYYNSRYIDFYENGTVYLDSTWKDNKLEGKSIQYYPNGKVRYHFNFKNGKLDGRYRIFNEDGSILEDKFYGGGIFRGKFDISKWTEEELKENEYA